jgi:hypothetical protein
MHSANWHDGASTQTIVCIRISSCIHCMPKLLKGLTFAMNICMHISMQRRGDPLAIEMAAERIADGDANVRRYMLM